MTVAVEELRELKSDQVVDARATSCPGPILAAKKAIGKIPVGGVMEVLAADSGTLHRRARRHERDALRKGGWRHAPERSDVVDYPDASSVRRDHQVVVARMDRQITNRDARHVTALVAVSYTHLTLPTIYSV